MEMDTDTKWLIAILISIVSMFFIFVAGAVYFLDRPSCNARWSEYPHEWHFLSGCRVNFNGKMIPEDAVRQVDVIGPQRQ
jgi:hypothetical protein